MDREFYINRNKQSAIALYRGKLDENRRVVGTNIWFDSFWRIHTN